MTGLHNFGCRGFLQTGVNWQIGLIGQNLLLASPSGPGVNWLFVDVSCLTSIQMAGTEMAIIWDVVVQGVAKSFKEIFGKLAPGGRGELVMKKALQPEAAEAEGEDGEDGPEEEGQAGGGPAEKYSGVRVKVTTAPLLPKIQPCAA